MVNDLKELMRRNTESAPPDHLDLATVVSAGRSRARRRRLAVGGAALATAGIVAVTAVGWTGAGGGGAHVASSPPRPDGAAITTADAQEAVPGRDYRELASHTNENLDADDGAYFDGVTDDNLVLFRGEPDSARVGPRFALMDPTTDEKQWLPELADVGGDQTWPVELSAERLVMLSLRNGLEGRLRTHVYDRGADTWTTLTWQGLPKVDSPRAVVGPDDRLYVRIIASEGQPPEGGWPTGPDGEADDADFEGDTYHLWSVSLTDPADSRDEGLIVGEVAFTDSAMVWTDRTGDAGMMHVRDLTTGEETSFDPGIGDRCNLLSLGAASDRIVMGQYCGTYANGRDDRVQILSTDGDQIVTIQDDGVDGWLPAGSDVVNVTVYGARDDERTGTYVYDLETDRFLRVSDGLSQWGLGGPTGNPGEFTWHTPLNSGKGATQHIGELL